jgi:pimeloyl-ACP methyl ester carboxylesterase
MHGSGGNFKAYTWLLSKVADKFGMIIIAPSFGLGNWSEPESTRVAVEALDHAGRLVAIDSQNVHLLGLSNGGLAVCQVEASSGSLFKSLVFLSPVFDRMALLTIDFQEHWKNRPILVITGKMDDRVPINYVQGMTDSIQGVGANITMKAIDDADHFMLFSHRDIVLAEISQWLKQHSVQK